MTFKGLLQRGYFEKYIEPHCEFCCPYCDTSDIDNIKYCKRHKDDN